MHGAAVPLRRAHFVVSGEQNAQRQICLKGSVRRAQLSVFPMEPPVTYAQEVVRSSIAKITSKNSSHNEKRSINDVM